MTGKELFDHYLTDRGEPGSKSAEYAQLLMTIFSNIHDEIFPFLERAEKEGKRLDIQKDDSVLWDEISPDEVFLTDWD